MNPTKNITPAEALSKLQNLCSQREKCSSDVREKLKQWNIDTEEQEKILDRLIKDKYIDDSRYAGFFVKDKQNINNWGKEKIRFALMRKKLDKQIIEEAISGLSSENFESSLREILERKSRQLTKYNPYERKNRLIRFAVQRGFDYDLIFSLVDDYVKG